MADADQRRRMLAALLSIQTKQSPLVNALVQARNAPPPANSMHRTPSAFANALNKPLPMEGRFGLLPLKDRNTLMGDERRDWALPGLLAGAWNAFTAPGRAAAGQPGFNPEQEAANFAGTFMGGGLLGSRMAPAPRGSIGMNAYHGSPHKFDAFDSSKIGTGEGAQAYGHGLYFAESKAVAGQYQANLSPQFQELVRYAGPDRIKTAAGMVASGVAENTAKDGLRALGVTDVDAVWNAGKRMAESAKGSLYHVDVPDEAIGRMLDWDKPLKEQPAAAKRAIMDQVHVYGRPIGDLFVDIRVQMPGVKDSGVGVFPVEQAQAMIADKARVLDYLPLKGEYLYKRLETDLGGAAQASARLRELGIPGIRYLDQASRGNGSMLQKFATESEARQFAAKQNASGGKAVAQPRPQGWVVVGEPARTRNFVLFDDKLAKITKRE